MVPCLLDIYYRLLFYDLFLGNFRQPTVLLGLTFQTVYHASYRHGSSGTNLVTCLGHDKVKQQSLYYSITTWLINNRLGGSTPMTLQSGMRRNNVYIYKYRERDPIRKNEPINS